MRTEIELLENEARSINKQILESELQESQLKLDMQRREADRRKSVGGMSSPVRITDEAEAGSYTDRKLRQELSDPLPTDYAVIGGNPEFYPNRARFESGQERFSTGLDYIPNTFHVSYAPRSKSPYRETADSNSYRNIHQTGWHGSAFKRSKSPLYYDKPELYNLLEASKIKRNILKAKLDSADSKLKELLKTKAYQKRIENETDQIRLDE